MKAVSRVLRLLLACSLFACVTTAPPLAAQADTASFEKSSLAWRTALHFDPAASAPLTSLVQLYQRGGRAAELLNVYANHLAQFPADEGAKVVLARLYMTMEDSRTELFIQQATAAHPQNAMLVHIHAQWLHSKLDPRALEAFDKAIELETAVPTRRAQWLMELLKLAVAAQREDVITARLIALVKDGAFTPIQRLQWARQALEQSFAKAADAALQGESFSALQGDDLAEAGFTRARVALANGRRAEASQITRDLLYKLAADHWRYREALTLRWQTAADDQERSRLLSESESAWKSAPTSESAALAYGDLLVTTNAKAAAIRVWCATLAKAPTARVLEERVISLMEQMRQDDELLVFLAERAALQPEREDLALHHARGLLVLGRVDEGLAALNRLLAKAELSVRSSTLLQTARWLRVRQLFGEGARVLESLLSTQPQQWEARKELAELYFLLKRQEDMERLFSLDMTEEISGDVRLEVAQFLIAKKLWSQARHLLQSWVAKRSSEFEGRLLLAKIHSLLGDEAAATRLLDECRALSDTDARYASWLATAWELATTQEKTAEFVDQERLKLWPPDGTPWDAARLSRLALLAQQTLQPNERLDAEKLLRQTLAAPTLPSAHRHELRLQLIQVLEGQIGREKEMEAEILKAFEEPGVAKGDLQVRLTLMYHAAKRYDLARTALSQINAEACENALLLSRAAMVATELGAADLKTSFYARLVHLQPDERAHWNNWIGALMERQDDTAMRQALREVLSRAKGWKLNGTSQDLLRRHLAASYWRSVARLLTDDARIAETLPFLDELERAEQAPQRRLWAVWVRATVAKKWGNSAALADARTLLSANKEEWVRFPDGLSLSMKEAQRLLDPASQKPAAIFLPNKKEVAPLPPLSLAWAFSVAGASELQRWDLTPDGKAVLAGDSASQIYLLDRRTGKLLWQRSMPRNADAPALPLGPNPRGEEQISTPPEWALTNECLYIVRDGTLFSLSTKDGSLLWQISRASLADDGCITSNQGRVLWWNAAESRLDAVNEANGRLMWSRSLPELAGPDAVNPQNPQWLAAGIHADNGKVLVWGNGSAVLSVDEGAVIWQASAKDNAPSFPLELSSEETVALPKQDGVAIGWKGMMPSRVRTKRGITMSGASVLLANPFATPSFGYPGMYGNAQTSPWVYWGTEQSRMLRGDGIWSNGATGAQQYSVLGLSARIGGSTSDYSRSMMAVGFAGKNLICVTENSVVSYDPLLGSTLLWNFPTWNTVAEHPMPNATLAGRSLLLAGKDAMRIQDAVSGTVLWEGSWPEEAKPLIKTARELFQKWQSIRWTSRGVFLYNGQGRTLTVDWKGLNADGDWILPAGTQTLMCLRGGPSP